MNKTKTTSTWISKRSIKPICNSCYSWPGEHTKTPNSKRRRGRTVVVKIKQRICDELTRMLPKAKIVGYFKTSTSLWFSSSVKALSSSRISTTFFLTTPLRILGSPVTKKKPPPKQPTLLHNGQNIPMATCHSLVAYKKSHCSPNPLSHTNCQKTPKKWSKCAPKINK